METYLERYLHNERLAVWSELVARGEAIRDERLSNDAQSVATEMMKRAKHNVALLGERLRQIEYTFKYPDKAWVAPEARLLATVSALERDYGPFPLVIRMWYEVVGAVNFMGTHPKLNPYNGSQMGMPNRLKCYPDPMVVGLGATAGLVSFYLNRAESEEEEAAMEEEMPPPYGLEIGLSAINKAGHSGGGSTAILVPNPAFDAPIIDSDLYWMGTFFVPYLRTCFEWGGFPGLRVMGEVPPDVKTDLEFLRKDLLPL